MTEISAEEFITLSKLLPEERFDYAVTRMIESQQIDFAQWHQAWLPGMQKNGTLVLVFPLSEDEEGIMLEAQEMLECIDEELQGE